MNTEAVEDPLRELLVAVSGDDLVAAREALDRYEPYLRMAVRRLLRGALQSKLDSTDIVQSIWADLLDGRVGNGRKFPSTGHLRSFLVRMAQNRLIDKSRKHRRAVEGERALEQIRATDLPHSDAPRPSQVAQGQELWEGLLERCPPAHREILRMKRQGASLAEIAQHCGLHESSVRRILYDLASSLPPSQD